ncbi:ribonucleoside triphosphate reductase [Candidatus Micrarchaeota archaeon]|nr:ribonucleoside triphosphate reductase [Candidatus Micrarchaeota archaeon]
MIAKIKKRDGRIVDFEQEKITTAIFKGLKAVGQGNRELAEKLSDHVAKMLEERFKEGIPGVEQIQDMVEIVLIENGLPEAAKAYILYREQHRQLREGAAVFEYVDKIIGSYIDQSDWRVKENSNAGYSVSALLFHAAGSVIAQYTLNNIYPKEVGDAHRNGDFHVHDLSVGIAGYCAGWSLRQLLAFGFNGVPTKTESVPAKHLNSAVWQMVNFLGTMQHEWAGAQAFSSMDAYLAPYVRTDGLDYKEIKQAMQSFVFNMNIASRWGSQTPFSNITMDWMVPEDLANQPAMVGGKEQAFTYGDCVEEMALINKAFMEIMMEGDAKGRIFTFPIPTYNVTRDFDWDTENADLLFKVTARFGMPYFQNFINSDLRPGDVRSMCCRLQLDKRELRKRGGGLFGAAEMTGSIGVVTLNLARIGFLSRDEDEFFERTKNLMEVAKKSLEIKRKTVQRNMDNGLLPYSKRYLGDLHNHFSTIGINGMNEAVLNFMGVDIGSKSGRRFALKVLDVMREELKDYQEETGNLYNLEATPAESTSYRFARIDKAKYKNIIVANEKAAKEREAAPYYTNSTQLPVGYTDDVFEALELQDELQTKYTGGTVLHCFVGESIDDPDTCKKLVKRIAYNFRLPYYTVTPTFSVCPEHGYIAGEHRVCPHQGNGESK